jgi:hypothetical protein
VNRRKSAHRVRLVQVPFALALVLTLLGETGAAVGAGQDGTPTPPRLVFSLSSGLTRDDNADLTRPASGARTVLDNRFGLRMNETTRLQALSLSLDGLWRLGNGDAGLQQPAVKLGYQLDTGNTRISLDLGDQRAPVNLSEPLTLPDGTLSATDLVAASGTVTQQSTGFKLETGLDQPLSLDLASNYDGRIYSDTTSTAVYDSRVRSASAGAHWRMDGATTLSLQAQASATDYARTIPTGTRNHALTLGFERALRPDLTLQTSLTQSSATGSTGGVTTSRSTGPGGSLALTFRDVKGSATVTLASERDALGLRNQLDFGRSLTFADGSFSVTAGVSARGSGPAEVVGSLAYARKRQADTIGLNLSRQIGLSSTTTDQASTVLALDWQHAINPVSRLGVSVNLSAASAVGAGIADRASRQTFEASWSHDLAQDWQFSAGYQYRALDQTTAGRVDSNQVFLTVSRKMILLP